MGAQEKKSNKFIKGTLILGAAGVIIKLLGAVFIITLGSFIGS